MTHTEKDSEELVELAYWIKNGVSEQEYVSARRPDLLGYYCGTPDRALEDGGPPFH